MVSKELVEIFGSGGNYAAVRMPGRKHYGIVFQADSLASLISEISEALRILREGNVKEAQGDLRILCDRLRRIAKAAEQDFNAGQQPPNESEFVQQNSEK